MNSHFLSDVFDRIDEEFIEEALLSYETHSSEKETTKVKGEKHKIHGTKKIISFALAACLLIGLGTAAWAVGSYIISPDMAEKVAREDVGVWKDMGLLSEEFELDTGKAQVFESPEYDGGSYWFGRIFKHRYTVNIASDRGFCSLTVDTGSGKIVHAAFEANADENDIPVRSEEIKFLNGPDPEKDFILDTVYYYENFDDIFPSDMTVDRFCSLLCEYWGFSGYTISNTVDTEFYNMEWEAVSGDSLLRNLPQDNYYLTVYFDGDQEGTPMYIQLAEYPGRVSLVLGTNHLVG